MDNGLSKFIFTRLGVPSFQKYLTLGSFRHKIISGNVANAATPGYKAEDIDFQGEFERLTKRTNHVEGTLTDAHHIPLGNYEARGPKINETKIKDGDVNSVDIDEQVSNMTQNEILYTVGADLLKRRFDGLRQAIKSQ